jgi:ribulose 1,5-bisphosphate synthetase/thiazole synthase
MTKRRDFLKNSLLLAAGSACPADLRAGINNTDSIKEHTVTLKRNIPVTYNADVVVIGGGIAGVSAACSAALSGVNVILIERFGAFGGVLTTGGVANFCDPISLEKQGEVFDEILSELRKFNSLVPKNPGSSGRAGAASVFNHEILALVLQEMLLRRNVKVLLHTRLVEVLVKGRNVTDCIVCGKSGLEAVRGKIFIDCSGEADMARVAGFSTMKGDKDTGYQLPMSKMFFLREVSEKDVVMQTPEDWRTRITNKDDMPWVSIWPDGPGGKAGKLKVPMFDATTTEGLTDAEIHAKRRTMDVLYYYQKIRGNRWYLSHSAPIIGIREGCRIEGDYILTVDDLRAGASFEDGVARGTFYLDAHSLTSEKSGHIQKIGPVGVPPYQIPMRSLIAKDADNLLMAGRCFSADQLALSSARVSTSGSMMGQAAGIAAAMTVRKKTRIRNLDYTEIKQEVLKRGAGLDV